MMRIERQIEYEAKNDAEAIRIAKERLGLDAVIISSRYIKTGGFLGFFKKDILLITAGIFEENPEEQAKESRERMVAFQHLLDARRAIHGETEAHTATTTPSDRVMTPARAVVEAYSSINSPITPPADLSVSAPHETGHKTSVNPDEGALRSEVDKIRATLDRVMERLDVGVVADMPASVIDELPPEALLLLKEETDKRTVEELSMEYVHTGDDIQFRDWLAAQIPVVGGSAAEALGGRKVLFVGSTGIGKTTTIAKLAAMQSLWDGRKVVLITADTYRIAAVEQLRTYAKILGIPIEIVFSPQEVAEAVERHPEADLFLLDTAGRNHQDGKRMSELKALYEAFQPDAVHLVLAANIKYRDMLDVVDRMGIIPLSALLFTKIDETSSCGPILSLVRDFRLPLSFLTTGQNVPNDIEVASAERLVELLLERGKEREER